MLNEFFKLVTFSKFSFFSVVRIENIGVNAIKCCFSAILAVVAYGVVEISFASDKVSEVGSSGNDSRNRIADSRELVLLPVLIDRVEAHKLIKDSGLKPGGGGEKLLVSHYREGVLIGRLSSVKRSPATKDAADVSTGQSAADATNDTYERGKYRVVHEKPLAMGPIYGQIIGSVVGIALGC